MLYYVVAALYVIVCFVLVLVILLQQGKGGDIAAAFGGASSQTAFGARSGATVLSRATTICFVLFLLGALTLSILGQRGPSSVLGNRPAPARPTPTAPAPAAERSATGSCARIWGAAVLRTPSAVQSSTRYQSS